MLPKIHELDELVLDVILKKIYYAPQPFDIHV